MLTPQHLQGYLRGLPSSNSVPQQQRITSPQQNASLRAPIQQQQLKNHQQQQRQGVTGAAAGVRPTGTTRDEGLSNVNGQPSNTLGSSLMPGANGSGIWLYGGGGGSDFQKECGNGNSIIWLINKAKCVLAYLLFPFMMAYEKCCGIFTWMLCSLPLLISVWWTRPPPLDTSESSIHTFYNSLQLPYFAISSPWFLWVVLIIPAALMMYSMVVLRNKIIPHMETSGLPDSKSWVRHFYETYALSVYYTLSMQGWYNSFAQHDWSSTKYYAFLAAAFVTWIFFDFRTFKYHKKSPVFAPILIVFIAQVYLAWLTWSLECINNVITPNSQF